MGGKTKPLTVYQVEWLLGDEKGTVEVESGSQCFRVVQNVTQCYGVVQSG